MSGSSDVIDAFKRFKDNGWLPGGQGAIAFVCAITDNSRKVYITPDPTGKQLTSNDLFILRDLYGSQNVTQPLNFDANSLKKSDWFLLLLDQLATFPECIAAAHVIPKWSGL